MIVLIGLILIFLLMFQGGFYSSAYLLVGITGTFFMMISKRRIVVSSEIKGLIILVIAYFLSAINHGISYSVLNQSSLLLICLVIACLIQMMNVEENSRLIRHIEVMGIISSVIGILIFVGVLSFPGGMNAGRLQFTFQYANVAGTWFAVCFILARDSKNKSIRALSFMNLIALFMTKSIGAIIVLFFFQTIWMFRKVKEKRTKPAWGIFIGYCCVCLIATLVVATRLEQGIYTFVERLIQIYDGLRVMVSNLLLGIGAGNWQYVYPFHQSAQYKAGVIHSSYVQMGVSAGIVLMVIMLTLLICVAIRFIRKYNRVTEAALFILFHSMLDYCLSFACIDVLLIILLETDSERGNLFQIKDKYIFQKSEKYNMKRITNLLKNFSRKIRITFCLLMVAVLCFGYYGTMQIRNMEKFIAANDNDKAIEIYNNNHAFMENGYKEKELYTEALFKKGEYKQVVNVLKQENKESYRMCLYKIMSEQNVGEITIDELINIVNVQPFNIELIEQITNIVENRKFSDSDVDKYNNNLSSINKKTKKWPACRLNNQKEADYAKRK